MVVNKSDFIEALTKEKFNAGCIKFNIPDEEHPESMHGEGVWGWVTPEDNQKYNDDKYGGKITAILVNQPVEYYGRLNWGDEVVLQCHGEDRPTLDPAWVAKNLIEPSANNDDDIEKEEF